MIEKTEGIVLRSRPFSRTSRMVTWLTPDFGRVTTVIKGACRPKSFFLGQTDLGYRCELLFYRKERAGAHIAREVFPLDCREALRGNWRASVAASYVCWLLSQVTEPMLASAELYELLDRFLCALSHWEGPASSGPRPRQSAALPSRPLWSERNLCGKAVSPLRTTSSNVKLRKGRFGVSSKTEGAETLPRMRRKWMSSKTLSVECL